VKPEARRALRKFKRGNAPLALRKQKPPAPVKSRSRSVIVYTNDGCAAFAKITSPQSNKEALWWRGRADAKGDRTDVAGRLVFEKECTTIQTAETKAEVIKRLKSEGYCVLSTDDSFLPVIDEGASIYMIKKNGWRYIGKTTRSVNFRLRDHDRNKDCASSWVVDDPDWAGVIEHMAPGAWTHEGLDELETFYINSTPNCVNIAKMQ